MFVFTKIIDDIFVSVSVSKLDSSQEFSKLPDKLLDFQVCVCVCVHLQVWHACGSVSNYGSANVYMYLVRNGIQCPITCSCTYVGACACH